MNEKTWTIIPVKRLSQAKRRLSPALPAEARRQLVLVMLKEVLGILSQVAEIDTVLVVTPDAHVAEIARQSGASVLSEARAGGLNAAVKAGLAFAREHGATAALILPGDVPFATADEVRRVVASASAGRQSRAVLVPSHDGEGTNALVLSPPGALEPSYGPGSFLRHLAQAVARKLDVQVLQAPGLAVDIDEPRDLARLIADKRGAGSYAFLQAHPTKPEDRPPPAAGGTEP
jgi:2-phospho-L-lactate guanylyltransferase